MLETFKKAIAHFDKKITDYQIYVDKSVQNQDKKIKTQENYLINTLYSHKKLIQDQNKTVESAIEEQNAKMDKFIEENANSGDSSDSAFTLVGSFNNGETISENGCINGFTDVIVKVDGKVDSEIFVKTTDNQSCGAMIIQNMDFVNGYIRFKIEGGILTISGIPGGGSQAISATKTIYIVNNATFESISFYPLTQYSEFNSEIYAR